MRKQTSEYNKDYYGWILSQADLLKNKEYAKVDWENMIEEIESLGSSERSRLESHLEILLMHMLKKKYQPEMSTRSWDLSIKQSKLKAIQTLKKNPSLKHRLEESFNVAYSYARLGAAQETGFPEKTFPEECPWNLQEILGEVIQ